MCTDLEGDHSEVKNLLDRITQMSVGKQRFQRFTDFGISCAQLVCDFSSCNGAIANPRVSCTSACRPRGQVMLQSWLELNRTDCRRAPDVENVDCPSLDSPCVHDRSHLLGEVMHVAVPFSGDRNLLLIAA
jgi:hypothetical protein